MKKTLRKLALAAMAVVFAGSIFMLIRQGIQYKQGEETYAEAESLAELPDFSGLPAPAVTEGDGGETGAAAPGPVYVDPYAEALRNMDFTALREVNSDVLGWIVIPGTVVSYPLVQGEDNQYYLKRSWKKWSSAVGAIFLECQNSPDLSDFNTIVYGHRMNNGSMFASLKYYKQQSYWAQHPCVYITDDNGSHKYDIFAAYEVSTTGTTYQIGFSGTESRQAFLDYCMDQSVISTGVTPTVNDKVLTLSTCTGNGHATRWVVQAVLKGVAAADSAPAQEETGGETTPPEGEPAPPAENEGGTPREVPAETEPAAETEAPAEAEPSADTEPPAA